MMIAQSNYAPSVIVVHVIAIGGVMNEENLVFFNNLTFSCMG
jgi:hypothetical protein